MRVSPHTAFTIAINPRLICILLQYLSNRTGRKIDHVYLQAIEIEPNYIIIDEVKECRRRVEILS